MLMEVRFEKGLCMYCVIEDDNSEVKHRIPNRILSFR